MTKIAGEASPPLEARVSGFTMPAEWSPQQGVLLSWPCHRQYWADCQTEAEDALAYLVAAITWFQNVFLLCPGRLQAQVWGKLNRAGVSGSHLHWLDIETNDVWIRDYGPIGLWNEAEKRLQWLQFRYNAWGGKFDHELDAKAATSIAKVLDLPLVKSSLTLEGGALESNGIGDLLTTEAVLLNGNRGNLENDSREVLEKRLAEDLGIRKIHWLKRGIEGDDTDGHIDDLARFISPDTILALRTQDTRHPDYEVLEENFRDLEQLVSHAGKPFNVQALPVPEPLSWKNNNLPASYANFLITPEAVFVPVFHQKSDDTALGIIRDAFPTRDIVVVDSRVLVREAGAVHCLTQQIPALPTERTEPPDEI